MYMYIISKGVDRVGFHFVNFARSTWRAWQERDGLSTQGNIHSNLYTRTKYTGGGNLTWIPPTGFHLAPTCNYGVPHKRWIVLKITRLKSNSCYL